MKSTPNHFSLSCFNEPEAEIRAIQRAYKAASGSKQRTAELLGISPRTLRHKLAQYKLKL